MYWLIDIPNLLILTKSDKFTLFFKFQATSTQGNKNCNVHKLGPGRTACQLVSAIETELLKEKGVQSNYHLVAMPSQ